MDYRVDFDGLSRAANDARGVADRTSSATSRMRLDLVSAAIPGSLSAGRANAVDAGLVEAARTIETDLAAYSSALAITAENYRAIEDTAEAAIQEFFGGTA